MSTDPTCKRPACGKPRAYPGALYCGAACSAMAQAEKYNEPLTVDLTSVPVEEILPAWQNAGLRASLYKLADEVLDERKRQMVNWPDCEHLPDGTGGAGRGTYEEIAKNSCDRAYREKRVTHAHVFEEECMEVLNATVPAELRQELIQVMAVCAKWIADIDGRKIP